MVAPKQGRSGGGLYTSDGYVAGVCDFAEPQGNHGLYAAPDVDLPDPRPQQPDGPLRPGANGPATRCLAENRPAPGRAEPEYRLQSPDRNDPGGVSLPPPEMLGIKTPERRRERRRRPASSPPELLAPDASPDGRTQDGPLGRHRPLRHVRAGPRGRVRRTARDARPAGDRPDQALGREAGGRAASRWRSCRRPGSSNSADQTLPVTKGRVGGGSSEPGRGPRAEPPVDPPFVRWQEARLNALTCAYRTPAPSRRAGR